MLRAKGNHPTIGGVVRLARLREIAQCIDALAGALLTALRPANPASRPAVLAKVQAAVTQAQKYDTVPGYVLVTPDQVSDIGSFAAELLKHDFGTVPVHAAATALRNALSGVKRYGDVDAPWIDMTTTYNFSDANLGDERVHARPRPQRRVGLALAVLHGVQAAAGFTES